MRYNNKRLWDIPHFSRYYISKNGEVYHKSNMDILPYRRCEKDEYLITLIDDNGIPREIDICRLLMNTFYGITNLPIIKRYKILSINDIHIDILKYDVSSFSAMQYPYKNSFILLDLEYRRIPDTDSWINEDGAVYRYYNNSFARKSYGLENPYPHVWYTNGRSDSVHRLIGYAFFNCPVDKIMNHRNGHMYDSYVSNLEVMTPRENTIHAIQTGLKHGHVITANDVTRICGLLEQGATIQHIRDALAWNDVSNETIARLVYRLVNNKAWADITAQYDFSQFLLHRASYYRVYSDEQAHSICKYLQDTDLSNKDIAKLTNTTPYLIQNIRCGAQYKDIRSQYNIAYETKIPRYSYELYEEILTLKCKNLSLHEISDHIGIPYSSIITALNTTIPKKYPDLCKKYNHAPGTKSKWLSVSQVHDICKAILNGESDKVLGQRYNVSSQAIADIRKGKNWTQISQIYGIPNNQYYLSPNPRALDPKLKQIVIDTLYNHPNLSNSDISKLIISEHGNDLGVDQYRVRNVRKQITDANDQLKPRELLGTPH